MVRVFVVGGTGFIGRALLSRLVKAGYEVWALVRSKARIAVLPEGVRPVPGDPLQPGPWQEEAARCAVGFNLAGASIFRRWSKEYKQLLRDSRILSTRLLGEALSRGEGRVLVNASAVGYYGDTGEITVEEDHPPGKDFLARLCVDWEKAALSFEKQGLRVAVARFGIVLGPDGGALLSMLPVFRLGLGGPIGSGRQWFPWIHRADVAAALVFLAETPGARGPFNLVAPEPVRQREFARELARVLRRPAFLPAPLWGLRLVFGEVAGVLAESCRAVPRRLLSLGFRFSFPKLRPALENILHKKGGQP
ncbi:TIGR01777 family oxidoreductase [Thermosulfurimonas sp. F29]|uniref:TIGR01777 family oxidoreductase n=1 Tax=Thermosulfurimonas sp. F29 TaxID=2867247 RepID=UPI001C82BFAF|nr:TIGR01777 family oxidoreductase [Thermosulfurimonas sp. F29]MBX6423989.1 TIGR01777 family oxidoreductase [Thermosulfurimonas sp. F29]